MFQINSLKKKKKKKTLQPKCGCGCASRVNGTSIELGHLRTENRRRRTRTILNEWEKKQKTTTIKTRNKTSEKKKAKKKHYWSNNAGENPLSDQRTFRLTKHASRGKGKVIFCRATSTQPRLVIGIYGWPDVLEQLKLLLSIQNGHQHNHQSLQILVVVVLQNDINIMEYERKRIMYERKQITARYLRLIYFSGNRLRGDKSC